MYDQLLRELLDAPARPIAALFVMDSGPYFGLDSVDPWPEKRDARRYDGEDPVVAHPPCSRWCQLAGLVQARWGHRIGEDGGCFASALANVRRVGGVLEHPAYSKAWTAHGLARPPRVGGWVKADDHGGWTCHVEQGHYGHLARKATWLYAVRTERPELRWGPGPAARVWISNCANNMRTRTGQVQRLSKKQRLATPPEFKKLLLELARSVV